MTSKPHKVRVGISIGDYNGIGPEIIIKTLSEKLVTDFFTPIIFGPSKVFIFQKNIPYTAAQLFSLIYGK